MVNDDYEGEEALDIEWRLSCLLEGSEKAALIDTGADGEILLHSMKKLTVEPDSVNAVMLPHNHWDHTCGLNTFLQRKSGAAVYVPRVIPESFKSAIREAGARVTETSQATPVCPGISTTPVLGGPLCLPTIPPTLPCLDLRRPSPTPILAAVLEVARRAVSRGQAAERLSP